MLIQPYEWLSGDDCGEFYIHIFGLTQDNPSKVVLVKIHDYNPFFRISFPSRNKKIAGEYIKLISKMLSDSDHEPIKAVMEYKKNLYGYSKDKTPFIKLTFRSKDAMRHCRNLINNKSYKLRKYGMIKCKVENNIDPIHRMITDAGIGYGRWLEVDGVLDEDKISNAIEITASWRDIKNADVDVVVSPLIASIDIEAYSPIHNKMPVKEYAKHIVFQLSLVTQRLYKPETRERRLIVVGPCDDIPGVEVIKVDNEIELIDTFCDLIIELNPQLITGYNIYGFDLPYMKARMDIHWREWKNMGIIRESYTHVTVKKWKSSAYKTVTVSNLVAEGRLFADMMTIIKRDHKLSQYTLENVSQHFLGHGKEDVSPKEMFEIFEERQNAQTNEELNTATKNMAKVGKYCVIDSELCIDLFEKLNTWIMLIELSDIVSVRPIDIFTRGQQVRVQNQVYEYTEKEGFVMIPKEGGTRYQGATVQVPVVGLHHNSIILDFSSLYPNIIRKYNICYSTLATDDIPNDMCNVITFKDGDNDIACKFIKEEYYHGILPRMCKHLIEERNKTRKLINPNNDPIQNEVLNQRQLGLKISANSIYGSLGVTKGTLPFPIGGKTITALGRELIGRSVDYVESLGFKVVYGDTDSIMVDTGINDPYECHEMGLRLEKEITNLFGKPLVMEFEAVYSLALFLKKKHYAYIAQRTIKLNPDDMIYKIDNNVYKANDKCVMIPRNFKTQKASELGLDKLMGIPLDSNGNPSIKDIGKKGIILARRDNCKWVRRVYEEVILRILFKKSKEEILDIIRKNVNDMMNFKIDPKDLVIVKGFGMAYSNNSTYFLKVFMDELKSKGILVSPGERVAYVVVEDSEGRKKLGEKMRLIKYYDYSEPIDRTYYVMNVLKKPITSLLEVIFPDCKDFVKECMIK